MARKKRDMRLPNNYGGIVYLGENRRRPYGVRVTIGFVPKGEKNGIMQYRQKYKYIGFFEKRTHAMECLVEYNKNPYEIDHANTTLGEIHREWSEKHFEKISANTKGVYITAWNKCERIHDARFADLRTKHLQEVIDSVESASIAKNVKLLLGMLYKHAMKHEMVEKDYSQFIELPKVKKKQPPKPFAKEEIQRVWAMEGNEIADMLLILLYSGMRIGELLLLENANIHLDERYMVGGLKTEAGIDRIIPIHKKIAHLIEKNMSEQKWLFFSRSKKPHEYSNVRQKASKWFKENGFAHTFHDTRHTFISQAQRLEINKLDLKRVVGHSDSDITEHYTHKEIADLVSAIDKFDY